MANRPTSSRKPELVKDVEIHEPGQVAHTEGPEAHLSAAPSARDLESLDEATGGGARELARAFQANAEALAGMHEIQAELATALKRGDRSELVLQSTQALNETFRNLTTIQRQMLTQMQEQGAATKRSPLVPLMILGLLVVLLGGIYLIVDQLQEARPSMHELAQSREDSERDALAAYRDGQEKGREEAQTQITAVRDEFERSKIRIHELEGERDAAQDEVEELERTKRSLEHERDELAERALKARDEIMARKLVEETARDQKADLIVAERKLAHAESELEKERRRNEHLMKRIGAYGLGIDEPAPPIDVQLPDRPTPDPAKDPSQPAPGAEATTRPDGLPGEPTSTGPESLEGPDAGLGTPPTATPGDLPSPTVRSPGDATPPQPGTAPRPATAGNGPPTKPVPLAWRQDLVSTPSLMKNIQGIVNRLLGVGAPTTRHKSNWQLTRIGGVTQDILGDCILMQYDEAGRVLGRVEAEQIRIVSNRDTGEVSFVLRNGRRVFQKKAAPLPPQGSKLVVANGKDHATAWHKSGLVMVHGK